MNTDSKIHDEIFKMFDELTVSLQDSKKLVNMTEEQLLKLQKLNKDILDEEKTVRSMFHADDVSERSCNNWEDRSRLDALHSKQRGNTCKDIKDKVFKLVQENTKDLTFIEERFGDIKGLPRTLVKSAEYLKERKDKSINNEVSSSTMDCKDILRMS
jgi:hypothetical protein